MVLLASKICDFGQKPTNFLLKSVDDQFYDWNKVKGKEVERHCGDNQSCRKL